jgi:hypothetical protein
MITKTLYILLLYHLINFGYSKTIIQELLEPIADTMPVILKSRRLLMKL